MYLLYLDDAGSVGNASDKHIVLAGIALFERQIPFLDKELNAAAAAIAPANPSDIEFHASHMLAGKGFWRSLPKLARQQLARDFRLNGHRWGQLQNLVDVPFFVDSRATRAIQYADMVAYALWRHYEKGDSEFFDIIEPAFDAHAGVRHGLCVQSLQPNHEMT